MAPSIEGKLLYVLFPGNNRRRLRWIVKKREDGRYIVRTPKLGAMIRDLPLKRDADFGKEGLLPLGTVIQSKGRRSTRKK